MALVGLYKIKESDQLFQCLESNIKQGLRSHGEYSLTDALDCMIKQGAKFKSFKVDNWFDCGKKDTLLESNATLLKKFGSNVDDKHHFENTVIIHPVSIGAGCDIKNSIIARTCKNDLHPFLNYYLNMLINVWIKQRHIYPKWF